MLNVNYDKILEDKEMPSIIKDLAREVKKRGGIHVGEWIKNLSTTDIWFLNIVSKQFVTDMMETKPRTGSDFHPRASDMMIMLVDILSYAEMVDTSNIADIIPRIELLSTYLSAEMLLRKGLKVKIFYENMTLDLSDHAGKKPIVEMGNLAQHVSEKLNLDENHKKILLDLEKLAVPGAQFEGSEVQKIYSDFLKIYIPGDKSSETIKRSIESMMKDMDIPLEKDGSVTGIEKADVTKILRYNPDTDGPLDKFIERSAAKLAEEMGGKGKVVASVIRDGKLVSREEHIVGWPEKPSEPDPITTPSSTSAQGESKVQTEEKNEPVAKQGFLSALVGFIKDYRQSNNGSAAKS